MEVKHSLTLKHLLLTIILLINLTAFATPLSPVATEKVVLKRGTPVTLRLLQDVNSVNIEENNLIELEVALDVVVNTQAVIATGAYAEGFVAEVKKKRLLGRGASLEIRASSAQAVDGQRVILIGQPLVKKADRKKRRFALSLLWIGLGLVFGGGIGAIAAAIGSNSIGGWMVVLFIGLFPLLGGILSSGREAELPLGTRLSATVAEEIVIDVNFKSKAK